MMYDPPEESSRPEVWRHVPSAELSGLVTEIIGYSDHGCAMIGVVEPASLVVPLIVSFGSPFHIGLGRKPAIADRHGSFAAGMFLGPVMMESDGQAECLQINFTPLGARRFFGLPMSELADRMVALGDLGDREVDALARQLAELNSWCSRLELAGRFVRARLDRSDEADLCVSWAFQRLVAAGGDVRIGALSAKLGWSRRKLVENFRRDIGLPPKAIARIVRLNRVTAMARTSNPDWADIAAACGYADQAHMTREFSQLAGQPPQAWRAAT
jgi:AraC-like DNA-binding protein